MGKVSVRTGIPLSILFALVFSHLTFAQEGGIIKIQGRVMELDLKKNTMIVNERLFIWNEKTIFSDDKDKPITVEKLSAKSWVNIEGANDKANQRLVAKKIYLLPKFIERKERYLYPFIQQN
jgi:hypothetical protein